MAVVTPQGLKAGFHAYLERSGVPGLVHAGDQWAPTSWFIGPHTHPVWELYLQSDGPPTRWRAGRAECDVPPRGLLAVPPAVEHQMVRPATTNWHFYFAAIDIPTHVEDMPDVASQWEAAGIISIPESGTALPSFEAFLREVTTGQPLRATGLRLSAMHLVVEVTRLFAEGASSRSLVVQPAVAGGGSSTPARPNG